MRTSTRMTLAAGAAVALGAVPLGAVFEDWKWIWYAWAAIAAVVGSHLLARSTRLPAPLVSVAGALGLLVYLTLVFAAAGALLGLVPTPASLRLLGDSLLGGLDDVNDLAAPVPATPGLVLLTAASVGALAVVVDAMAVSARRPAAAGLPLLALYAVPTAVVLDGVPWVLFAIGATGYLVLLLVEGRDRLLRWGRPVGTGPDDEDTPLPLTGQRIAATAIAIAVVVPVLIPGVTGNALSRIGRTGTGDGSGTGGALNEFASLRGELQRREPVELMRVQTSLERPFYLRTKVLDVYTAAGFGALRPSRDERVSDAMPLPAGQEASTQEQSFETRISLGNNYRDNHLPIYYLPQSIQGVDESWWYDRGDAVVIGRQRTDGLEYTVRGVVPDPSAERLASSGPLDGDDREVLPGSTSTLPESVRALMRGTVEDVTRNLSSPFAKAKALNGYFTDGTNGFTYALSTVQGNSGSVLVDFLEKKQGYCEQYAAAMAIMLRVADIPSRVVIGYTSGRRQEDGTWSVTTNDAHAWVEGYFHDVGWVFFDPTPLSDGRTLAPPYAPRPAESPTPSSSVSGGAGASSGATRTVAPDGGLEEAPQSGGGSDSALVTPRRALLGGGVLAVLLLALTPAAVRLSTRRRRLRAAGGTDAAGAARAAWDEVIGTVTDFGVAVPQTETPRGLARRIGSDVSLDPGATAGLRLVALAEERARYAPRAGVDGDLPGAVQAVRRGLRAGAGRQRRWRAVLLPPSTVRAARSGSALRAAAASTALSRLGEAVRRPVTPRRR